MIQIIGGGAIGCLWLAKLQQSGFACHLVSRASSPAKQLIFTDLQQYTTHLSISHSNQLLKKQIIKRQSTILVCVKAPQVLTALLKQQSFINDQQVIILMHNGYGCAEEVEKHFPNNPIICATTANASLLNSPLNITQTGHGPSYFGLFRSHKIIEIPEKVAQIENVFTPFQHAMPNVNWSQEIRKQCWLKLIINAVINPLTAIHQIKNGQLQSPEYALLIQVLIIEIHSIAEAQSFSFNLNTLQEKVSEVIKATSENFSSMNRDVFYRRETEIEYINGYLINIAKQHNIETPMLNDLYQQIKSLENR